MAVVQDMLSGKVSGNLVGSFKLNKAANGAHTVQVEVGEITGSFLKGQYPTSARYL